MKIQLKNIATLQFGIYAQPTETGTIPYLQAIHFSDLGLLHSNVDTFIDNNFKYEDIKLCEGDVLFTSKGFRNFATLITGSLINTVASSLFFIIKVDERKILPQYLVATLNAQKNIQYFQQLSAGQTIPSIRKNEVLDFTFNLPDLQTQQKIVEMYQLFLKDISLTENLLQQKHILYNNTISQLIK